MRIFSIFGQIFLLLMLSCCITKHNPPSSYYPISIKPDTTNLRACLPLIKDRKAVNTYPNGDTAYEIGANTGWFQGDEKVLKFQWEDKMVLVSSPNPGLKYTNLFYGVSVFEAGQAMDNAAFPNTKSVMVLDYGDHSQIWLHYWDLRDRLCLLEWTKDSLYFVEGLETDSLIAPFSEKWSK